MSNVSRAASRACRCPRRAPLFSRIAGRAPLHSAALLQSHTPPPDSFHNVQPPRKDPTQTSQKSNTKPKSKHDDMLMSMLEQIHQIRKKSDLNNVDLQYVVEEMLYKLNLFVDFQDKDRATREQLSAQLLELRAQVNALKVDNLKLTRKLDTVEVDALKLTRKLDTVVFEQYFYRNFGDYANYVWVMLVKHLRTLREYKSISGADLDAVFNDTSPMEDAAIIVLQKECQNYCTSLEVEFGLLSDLHATRNGRSHSNKKGLSLERIKSLVESDIETLESKKDMIPDEFKEAKNQLAKLAEIYKNDMVKKMT